MRVMQSRGPKHTARAEKVAADSEMEMALTLCCRGQKHLELREQLTPVRWGAAHLPVTAKDTEFLIINNKCSFHSVLLIGTYRIYTSKVEKQVCTKGN